MHILKYSTPYLVEDDPLARWITRKALEEAGAAVTEAEDCAVARDMIDRMRFNLLVLDYRLPDGNGLDVLRYVRSKGHDDKAIVLSAEADIFNRSYSGRSGYSAGVQQACSLWGIAGLLKCAAEGSRSRSSS